MTSSAKAKHLSPSPGRASCSICLEAVECNGQDRSVAKLKCGHQFHLGYHHVAMKELDDAWDWFPQKGRLGEGCPFFWRKAEVFWVLSSTSQEGGLLKITFFQNAYELKWVVKLLLEKYNWGWA